MREWTWIVRERAEDYRKYGAVYDASVRFVLAGQGETAA